jgi:hypothetical protein
MSPEPKDAEEEEVEETEEKEVSEKPKAEGKEAEEKGAPNEAADGKDASYWRGQAEALKSIAKEPATNSQQQITVETLQGMNPEQREYLEKQVGRPFDEIVRSVESNERRTMRSALDESRAKEAVSDALDELAEVDPQSAKLKRGIKEYLSDVPSADKLNPERLKAHLEKAKIYARGKLVSSAPPPRPAGGKPVEKNVKAPKPDEDDASGTPELEEGEVGYGDHEYKGFKLSVKPLTEKIVGKEKRQRMRHPDDPNGVKILSADFDEEPKFR